MLRLASLALSGAGVALLALGRGHYTIDILVAYWVSSWLWRVYHAVAHLPSLRQQSHNPLAGLACWHLIRLGSPSRGARILKPWCAGIWRPMSQRSRCPGNTVSP